MNTPNLSEVLREYLADGGSREVYNDAKKELAALKKSQLTPRAVDFAPESRSNCTVCGGLLPKHNLPCSVAQSH